MQQRLVTISVVLGVSLMLAGVTLGFAPAFAMAVLLSGQIVAAVILFKK